jgi:hypothetical protein
MEPFWKNNRLVPCYVLLAAFGLMLVNYGDMTEELKRLAVAVLCFAVIAGIYGWYHDAMAHIYGGEGKGFGRQWTIYLGLLLYTAIVVALVYTSHRLFDLWPADDQPPALVTPPAGAGGTGTEDLPTTTEAGQNTQKRTGPGRNDSGT